MRPEGQWSTFVEARKVSTVAMLYFGIRLYCCGLDLQAVRSPLRDVQAYKHAVAVTLMCIHVPTVTHLNKDILIREFIWPVYDN